MTILLAQIDGRDPATGEAITLRAASVDDDRVCHLNGQLWWPALSSLPALRYDLFDGAFGAAITTPQSSMGLAIGAWPSLPAMMLADARVQLWTGEIGDAWASYAPLFDGRVTAQPPIAGGVANLSIAVDDRWLDEPLLDTYAGTTGIEGDAALKGQPKPLALGAPRYVSGILIDATNTVVQLSAYGAIEDVEVALDRLTRFSPSVGDYPNYAALVAATIPAGAWATCKAQGLVRHGAPPEGRLSYLVRGDKASASGWVRKPGALIKRIALMRGATDRIDHASLDALDAYRPWNLSVYVGEQTTARALIQEIAASVNAVAGVTWLGKLFVTPVGFGSPLMTLDSSGSAMPPVASVEQLEIAAPFWKLSIEAEKTWSVHGLSEVAFSAVLVDRGQYIAIESYREGHIVSLADGSRWLYIATTPSSGNAPASGSSFWAMLSVPITYADGTSLEALKPAEQGATNSADPNSPFGPGSTVGAVLDAIGNIASDNVITKGEKWQLIEIRRQYHAQHNAAYFTSLGLDTSYGDDPTATERAAAFAAMNALNEFLGELAPPWDDTSSDTPVAGATLRELFEDVAEKTADLVKANSKVGSERALVDGKIYDMATGNFLTRGGLITALGISAGITGQGSLATQSNVNLASQVTGLLGLGNAAAGLVNSNISIGSNGVLAGGGGGAVTFGGLGGGPVGQLNELFFGHSLLKENSGGAVASLANFKTGLGISAGITGQGSGATANSLAQLNATDAANLTNVMAAVGTITNDNIIATSEKMALIELWRQQDEAHTAAYYASLNLNTEFGSDPTGAERSASVTAANNLLTYLTSLSPTWNDPTVNTPVDGPSLRGLFAAAAEKTRLLKVANERQASIRSIWGSVSGAGKPTDNADVTAANTAAGIIGQGWGATAPQTSLDNTYVKPLDVVAWGATVHGTVIFQNSASGVYDYAAYATRILGPSFVAVGVGADRWHMVALDNDLTSKEWSAMTVTAHYHPTASGGTVSMYVNGASVYSSTAVGDYRGYELQIVYDGSFFRLIVGGIERVAWPTSANQSLFPVWHAYEMGTSYMGLRSGPARTAARIGSNTYDNSGNLKNSADLVTLEGISAGFTGQGWAATQGETATSNALVPVGSNVVVNSSYQRGLFGWFLGGSAGGYLGINAPSYSGSRSLAYINHDGEFTTAEYADAFTLAESGSFDQMKKYALPVKPGDRVGASMLMGHHRCSPELLIVYYDSTGAYVAAHGTSTGSMANGGAGGENLGRVSMYQIVPANTRYATIRARMYGTGESNAYLFFAEAWLGLLGPNQTTVPPYTPGPPDYLATLGSTAGTDLFRADGATVMTQAEVRTPEGVAAAITGQADWATYTGMNTATVAGKTSRLFTSGYSTLGNGGILADETNTYFVTNNHAITALGTAAAIAGQGPGATAPAADVLNHNEAGGVTTIAKPEGGSLYQPGGATGAFEIRLPLSFADTMLRFYVDVFDYAEGGMQTYLVAGYSYDSANRLWYNMSAQMVGGSGHARPVRFGHNSAGTACIWIGNVDSSWGYAAITVRDVQASYYNYLPSQWKSGWSITLVTSFHVVRYTVDRPVATDMTFGVNAYETWGGAVATKANFKTAEGTAAAFQGQGALATKSTVTYGTADVTGFGALAARPYVYFGDGYLLRPGGATANDADYHTASGVAAGFAGQGALATQNSVAYGSGFVTGFGTFAALSQINSGNITSYIANQAIGSAVIANLAVGTAHLDNLAVTGAKIADASITSAKIVSLAANKIDATSISAISANLGTMVSTAPDGSQTIISGWGMVQKDPSGNVILAEGNLTQLGVV